MTMHYDKDADGIVTVTMDMAGPVNAMNEEFRNDFGEVVDQPPAAREGQAPVAGIECRRLACPGAEIAGHDGELMVHRHGPHGQRQEAGHAPSPSRPGPAGHVRNRQAATIRHRLSKAATMIREYQSTRRRP